MNCRIAIYVGLVAPIITAATAVQAQVYYGPPRVYVAPPYFDGGLPPGEILMRVRAAGLAPLTRPERRGPRYLLLASDYTGGQLRVVVNAYNGRIMRVMPAYDPRFASQPVRPRGLVPVPAPEHRGAPPVRYGAAPPEVNEPPRASGSREAAPARSPASTGSAPDHRLASAPPAADPAPPRPARTPLPRPRPRAATAANSGASAPTETAAAPTAAPPPAAPQPQPAVSPAPAPQSKPVPAETQLVPVAPLE